MGQQNQYEPIGMALPARPTDAAVPLEGYSVLLGMPGPPHVAPC